MKKQTEKRKNLIPTKMFLQETISEYLGRCIECNRCMDICPVTKETVSVHDLNVASQEGQPVPLNIKEFTFHCTQCGKCVPVCPKDIRRDLMMRYIKYKIKGKKPWSYKRYLFIKGPQQTGIRKITQQLFIRLKKLTNRDLSSLMETTPERRADVLFYPGCYLYSTRTMRRTLRLLDHLDCSYTVLGGVTTCCGAPHLLQGEFDQADACAELLYQKIKACDPRIIITSCAECFEAIETIKKTQKLDVEVLSVTQYLLRFPDKYPSKRIREKITVHHSCRFPAHSPQGQAAQQAASRFGELTAPSIDQSSSCCYQWNHGCDPANTMRRSAYLAAIQTKAPVLACDCLTCYEEFKKTSSDVQIIDVLQLFEEALDAQQTKAAQR